MRLRPLALGAFVCACAGGEAIAQQPPGVGSERQIHGFVSVTGTYDSNFARSNKATAAARAVKPREYLLAPKAGLNVVQPFGRQVVYLNGSAGYDFHRENSQLDRRRYDVQGGYVTSLGMCQLSAVETFRAAQSDLADLDGVNTRNELRAIGTSLSTSCGRPTGIAVSGSVSRLDAKNSAALQKPADSTLESLSLQVGYSNENLGRFSLVYSYADTEMPNRITPGRPVGDGFWSETYALSVERDLGSRLTLSAQGGRTRLKREFAPPGVPQEVKTTTYSGQAAYRIGSRMSVNLSGERTIKPAQRAGKLYDVTTGAQVSGQYQLGTRYTLSAGYSIRDVDSNADTLSARPVITNSRNNSVFGSVRYQQSELASLVLDVRYEERDTDLPEFNYSAMRVGITAQVGF